MTIYLATHEQSGHELFSHRDDALKWVECQADYHSQEIGKWITHGEEESLRLADGKTYAGTVRRMTVDRRAEHRQYEAEQQAAARRALAAPTGPFAPAQWATIHNLVAWLDEENSRSEQEMSSRLLKLTEEAGEAAQAWIGMTGHNPRKGISHTVGDVADELCDVIVAAAIVLASLVTDPAGHLDTQLSLIASRPRTPTP